VVMVSINKSDGEGAAPVPAPQRGLEATAAA